MVELSDPDRLFVGRLLDAAEAEGITRRHFLERVSLALERKGMPSDRRQAIYDHAYALAESSEELASDTVQPRQIDNARRKLRECGARLAGSNWRRVVREQWPAPIAHEVERLFGEMEGRRAPDGTRDEPSPAAALLQLRDTYEVLIKLTATILLRSMIEAGGESGETARRLLFRPLSAGSWSGMLRDAAKACASGKAVVPEAVKALAASALVMEEGIKDFSSFRNDFIGHGAYAHDPEEVADLVIGCVETGKVRTVQGEEKKVPSLASVVEDLVKRGIFAGITLEAIDGGVGIPLTGAGPMEHWLADERHADHNGDALPLALRLDDGATLPLAPFAALRACKQCGRRDVLLYDSLHDRKRGGRFDLLDYARGHKSRLAAAEAPDLGDSFGDLAQHDIPDVADGSRSFDYVLEALDRARVDRNYLSPAYLRADLAAFLEAHDRGVYWLQAPANIGKTTFVQGLVDRELGDAPIDPRFDDGMRGRRMVAYFCRKEFRTGTAGIINTLHDALQKVLGSQTFRDKQPEPGPAIEAASPEAFVVWLTAWRDFAVRYHRLLADAPLLVVIDGLDEAEPPDGPSPIRLLPPPSLLPEGLYLLLTSRPDGAGDAPRFLADHVAPLYAGEGLPVRARSVDLGSEPYQALLAEYLRGRLKLDLAKAGDAELVAAIIAAADDRFAYVSFLADRYEGGQVTREALARGEIGEALYGRWLANLDREYGPKQAESIRQALAMLAAAEQAHAWVFGEGRRTDPATGGVLTALPEVFEGLEIGMLAQLLDLDRPAAEAYDRIDPGLLITLQTLQGVLRVTRPGRGATHFRLALKQFLPAAEADALLGPRLRLMNARLATAMLDAADVIVAENNGAAAAAARDIFMALSPLAQAAVALSGSETVEKRWRSSELVGVVRRQTKLLGEIGHHSQLVDFSTTSLRWYIGDTTHPEGLMVDQISGLLVAAALTSRAVARQTATGHGLRMAIADYNVAVRILEGLLASQDPQSKFGLGLRDALAKAYMSRGTARQDAAGHGPCIAIDDYDAAIEIMEGLRSELERRGGWGPGLRNSLATAYMNRGNAKRSVPGLGFGPAISDYDVAIAIMKGLRSALEHMGQWDLRSRRALATAFTNRGSTRQDVAGFGASAAIADHDEAIAILEGLRSRPEQLKEWGPGLRNDLANAYMNRGNAKRSTLSHGFGAAIRDYDKAIMIRSELRSDLEPGGEWGPSLRNDLAVAYMNRGSAKTEARGRYGAVAAIADHNAAITILEGLRSVLESRGEWGPNLRNTLATVYMNRGNSKFAGQGFGPSAAIVDYDKAISIRKQLRADLEPQGAWGAELRNDLAMAYMNRGNAKQEAAGYGALPAVADYDAAIAIMEGLRAELEPRGEWSPILRNNLATAYMNRGNAKQHALGHGALPAVADYDAAIALMKSLRADLDPRGEWGVGPRNDLAVAYMNRGNAKRRAPGYGAAAAIVDYDVAIAIRESLRADLEPRGEWGDGLRVDLGLAFANLAEARLADGAMRDADAAIGLIEPVVASLGANCPPRYVQNLEFARSIREQAGGLGPAG